MFTLYKRVNIFLPYLCGLFQESSHFDAVAFVGGEALDIRICGQSLIKIKSTQICTINSVKKLAKTTKLFRPYNQIGKCFIWYTIFLQL